MSFSQEVKNEILRHRITKPCCNVAAAYAVACFGKYFSVLNALVKVVNDPNGTGYSAYMEDVVLAGKTGTAEIKEH